MPGTEYVYALVATSVVCTKSPGSPEFEDSQCMHEKKEGGWSLTSTTVIEPGRQFTVAGTPIIEAKPNPLTPEYPTGPLAAPAPVSTPPQIAHAPYTFPQEEASGTPPPTKKTKQCAKGKKRKHGKCVKVKSKAKSRAKKANRKGGK